VKKIIGCVRVSTPEQSFDYQIEKLKEYAKPKDLNRVNIYSDHATGKNVEHVGFQDMIEHLKS